MRSNPPRAAGVLVGGLVRVNVGWNLVRGLGRGQETVAPEYRRKPPFAAEGGKVPHTAIMGEAVDAPQEEGRFLGWAVQRGSRPKVAGVGESLRGNTGACGVKLGRLLDVQERRREIFLWVMGGGLTNQRSGPLAGSHGS